MAKHTFKCQFCNQDSGFSRRAAATVDQSSANPYARATRKYRCEQCSRVSDITRPRYDWTLVDWEQKPNPPGSPKR